MTTINELMGEFELSDADLEQRAQEYETENWSLGHDLIYSGSQRVADTSCYDPAYQSLS